MLRLFARRGAGLAEGLAGSLARVQLAGSEARRRSCAALPQPADEEPSDGFNYESSSADAHAQAQAAYNRRLHEMAIAAAAAPWQLPGSRSHSAAPGLPRSRSRALTDLPTLEQVAERLKTHSSASCSTQQPSSSSSSSSPEAVLDWREVVAAMRSAQQTVTGEQMLTDSFG